jgi:Cu/Ag efflux pump CusA
VVLTAAATVLAMVPLTRSVFWGPMAIAIMGGLTIATVLTIFFVPASTRPGSRWHRQEAAPEPRPAGEPVPAT